MKTVIIETTEPSRRFEIDLANEPREFVEEFQKFVSKLEVRSPALGEKKRKRLTPQLKQASDYIDSISKRPESNAALAESDKIRKDWIRKNV